MWYHPIHKEFEKFNSELKILKRKFIKRSNFFVQSSLTMAYWPQIGLCLVLGVLAFFYTTSPQIGTNSKRHFSFNPDTSQSLRYKETRILSSLFFIIKILPRSFSHLMYILTIVSIVILSFWYLYINKILIHDFTAVLRIVGP